jgi:hypothetical protein
MGTGLSLYVLAEAVRHGAIVTRLLPRLRSTLNNP